MRREASWAGFGGCRNSMPRRLAKVLSAYVREKRQAGVIRCRVIQLENGIPLLWPLVEAG